MAADPVQAIVDFSTSVQSIRVIAPFKKFLPIPGQLLVNPAVPPLLTKDFRRGVISSVHPGPYVGTQVIQQVDVSQTSPLGRFRGEVHAGPSPYQLNGRPGTPSISLKGSWNQRYIDQETMWSAAVLISEDDLHPLTAVEYYTDNDFYLINTDFGTQFRSVSPLIAGDVLQEVCASVNNPYLNPILRGEGGNGGSVRPDDGLLYPRKV
ncbi:hypothetical protein SynSYN20_01674 [Synechococcus sp. SYN20]|uniref:hypothetical protein n=1 Tax=Synechococcus sp. SYN20 TaxID=1050714 RepID=UPI0016440546|nr:hypothetical protein [Synechococcus sp. SYN20]QNJ26001.1 hypothetical protein SynSYN20_01674 [Synechococcus sp. SYN20]